MLRDQASIGYSADHLFGDGWNVHQNYRFQHVNFQERTVYGIGFAPGSEFLLNRLAYDAVLWWPGLRLWTRGLRVSFGHSWRRINYDAHGAIGIWTLAIVSWWAFSAVYFAWYRQVGFAVNMISPVRNMLPPTAPKIVPSARGWQKASLAKVLEEAQRASRRGALPV